ANAALKVQKREPFILDRSEGYMGVMIDDLVTKGTNEPYRMFTSRAEYRLLFREDNADLRLLEKGYELGLHDDNTLKILKEKRKLIEGELTRLENTWVKPSDEVNALLAKLGSTPIDNGISQSQLLKRPEIVYGTLKEIDSAYPELPDDIVRQVEIQCKYEGYLKRQEDEVRRFKNLEKIKLPSDIGYKGIPGISNEICKKLSDIKPFSLGQASRISGITPAAISILMVWLKRYSGDKIA
ncbi:MAG: tRNA uridine-5-carboxymethylaminomethyl(34) synthesis enzyme MnmG, partial [Candidatus Latescibacteria bacterium]|nr:tRNA uridine-5-carboxymethylaminomethyl(34) synthesis enzyme MnmG [Candidatus Latescibacterota bacterium]